MIAESFLWKRVSKKWINYQCDISRHTNKGRGKIYGTMTTGRRNSLSQRWAPLVVIQWKVVSLETLYTTKNGLSIYILVCTCVDIYKYVRDMLKEREASNLRTWGHGACLRKHSWEFLEDGKRSSETYEFYLFLK